MRHWAKTVCATLAWVLIASLPTRAAGVEIIRDAEIEQLLRDYATPLFRAAGIHASATKVTLVGDRSFNAFVADGQKIFVNVGTLMKAKTPNEVIGVLAHEIGHIAGGHLVRMHEALAKAQIMAVAGMLMSAGAIAVGANNQNSVGSDPMGAMGVLLGPQELVRRAMLSYQRGQEASADRAAVRFLDATHQSARGLLSTLEAFKNDALFEQGMDPYLVNHPLPAERIANLQSAAQASGYFDSRDPQALQGRHDMMRAKLYGYMARPEELARHYGPSDTSLAARYAWAINTYRFGRPDDALARINSLIAAQPKNPYFYELKGQALLEAGHAAQALEPLHRAVALAPGQPLIQILLGHALVALGTGTSNDEAIKILSHATLHEDDSAEAYEFLAMAYNRQNKVPQAQLAAAENLFALGKYVAARTQASRAQAAFPRASPGWLKADDILNYRPPNVN